MGPAPMMSRRRGRSWRSKIVSLVSSGVASSPGMGGPTGLLPVAISARRNRRCRSSTAIVLGPVKRASPKKTSTPAARRRATESCAAIVARRARMRAITRAKSARTPATSTPRLEAWRSSPMAPAERSSAFDGTHPVFRQSPPRRSRSTSATRAPSPAAPIAPTSPAVPPPITTRSYACAGVGFRQSPGRMCARYSAATASAASAWLTAGSTGADSAGIPGISAGLPASHRPSQVRGSARAAGAARNPVPVRRWSGGVRRGQRPRSASTPAAPPGSGDTSPHAGARRGGRGVDARPPSPRTPARLPLCSSSCRTDPVG
jgi:hypothetical protein